MTACGCVHAVEAEVQEVARSAVRSLRGVRLCAEGHEEGRLTHLVLGRQRRTLKVHPRPSPHPVCDRPLLTCSLYHGTLI